MLDVYVFIINSSHVFQISELNSPHIHINDPDHVKEVVNNIISGGHDQLQVRVKRLHV